MTFFFPSPQEQSSRVQSQLNDEEIKNSKLLQQIAKLEEQMAVMSQESEQKDEVIHVHLTHISKCEDVENCLLTPSTSS